MMAVWDKLILLRSGNAGWSFGDAQTDVTLEHGSTTSGCNDVLGECCVHTLLSVFEGKKRMLNM